MSFTFSQVCFYRLKLLGIETEAELFEMEVRTKQNNQTRYSAKAFINLIASRCLLLPDIPGNLFI